MELISDGTPHDFSFAYEAKANPIEIQHDNLIKPQYFLYLPTAHKFDLQLDARLKSFQSGTSNLYGSKVSDGLETNRLDDYFFNFKVALKKLELRDNLKGTYVKWSDEFTHDEQFDHVF